MSVSLPASAIERLAGFLAVRRYPAIGLALVRISYGASFLFVIATNAGDWRVLWGADSIYLQDLGSDPASRPSPNLYMALDSDAWVAVVLILSAVVGVLFTIGCQTRISTVLMLVCCWSLSARDPLISDGGDNLMVIALFLLCFANTGERLSVDNVFRRRRIDRLSSRRREAMADRLKPYSMVIGNLAWMALVVQVCIVYSTSGLAKVQGVLWQQGTALYYILRSAEFSAWPALSELLFRNGYLTTIGSYATVLVQVFFPFLVFNRVLKLPTIATVIGIHTGIGILMGLPVFALVMIGTEMIFVPDAFWYRLNVFVSRRSERFMKFTASRNDTAHE